MKRIIAVIMLIVCTFAFTACTKKSISKLESSSSVKDSGTKTPASSSESKKDKDTAAVSDSKNEADSDKGGAADTVNDTEADSEEDDEDIELIDNPDFDIEIDSVEHVSVSEDEDGNYELNISDSSEDEDKEEPLFYFGTYGLQVYVYSHDALEVLPGEITLRGIVGNVEDPESIQPYAPGDVIDIHFDALTELHNPEMLDHYEPGFDAVDWLNNLAGDEYGVGVAGVYDVLIHNCRVEDVFGLYWWD